MRWLWIDQIIELEPNTRLVAIKNISLAEDYLHDHFAGDDGLAPLPTFPASLLIEGMAQTAGILVGSARNFQEKVILAKIIRATFECEAFAGHTLRYEASIERLDDAGAATTGRVSRFTAATGAWEAMGQVDLLFSHVLSGADVPTHNFVFGENLRLLLQGLPGGMGQHS